MNDLICFWCSEPILDRDNRVSGINFNMHQECMVRSVTGSVDHILRGPHPVGSCLPDDPELTLRQAALAAFNAWRDRDDHLREPSHTPAEEPVEEIDIPL